MHADGGTVAQLASPLDPSPLGGSLDQRGPGTMAASGSIEDSPSIPADRGVSPVVGSPSEAPDLAASPRRGQPAPRGLVIGLAAALVVGIPASVGLYLGVLRGTQEPAPRDVLLTAAHRASTESLRMAVTANETFSASGPAAGQFAALSGQPITIDFQIGVQNRQRSSGVVTVTAGGRSVGILTVLYDGTAFLSKDNGLSFQTLPLSGQVSSQYGPDSALQYLQSVSTVTDNGPASVDGVAVERYHAQLDGAKITDVIKSGLSRLKGAFFQRVSSAIRFTGGTLDASIDHSGHLVHDDGFFDAAMDLTAVDPSLSGTTMTIHGAFDGRFFDYGAPITVERPGNVTGAAPLP